ncbi:MAG: MCE family protein [Frankiaceae bacterium]|nr:MCE family protein [Frankiaceae bacterium]MBV9871368.1 MCE family protein [Frankiaceae bacterium]
MKLFSERRPVPLAIGTVVVTIAALVFALEFGKIFTSATTYHANLANAASLAPGEDVRLSGVRVGTVKSLSLDGDHVRMTFTVRHGVRLGADTRLNVEVLTPLGNEYVTVVPEGAGQLPAGATIPIERTSIPLTLVDAFSKLGSTLGRIDVSTLTKSLDAVSAATTTSPKTVRAAMRGIAALSTNFAKHENDFNRLFTAGDQVSRVLDQRRAEIVAIMGQSDQVLQVLSERKAALTALSTSVDRLARHVETLLRHTHADLGPLLQNLDVISRVLDKNKRAIGHAIPTLATFDQNAANANGSGLFNDLWAPTLLIPDNVIKQCSDRGQTTGGCDL